MVADPEERARHLGLAATGPDEHVATAMDDAARRAAARGAQDAAAAFMEQAAHLTPPDAPDVATRRRLDAADHHVASGDPVRARTLIEEIVATADAGPTRARALHRLARARALERGFGIVPPLVTTGLLAFGLWQLGSFQKQERVWRLALDRARILSLVNFGLSPFLYWWNRAPAHPFFLAMVIVMVLSALLFVGSINQVLRRLGAMIPDEALRLETRQFTALNFILLSATFGMALLYAAAVQLQALSFWLGALVAVMEHTGLWLLILLVLLPLAMTMALLWKTKEVILDNVFSASR